MNEYDEMQKEIWYSKTFKYRIYYDVSYEQKEKAKELGLRWDPDIKCWFLYNFPIKGEYPDVGYCDYLWERISVEESEY